MSRLAAIGLHDGNDEDEAMFIRSERLFLRPGWPEDWTELQARIADEGIVRHPATVPWPYSPEHAQSYAEAPQAPRHPHFLVTLPGAEGSRLIGCVGLGRYEGETELGYWIAREVWNQGYGTEAARAVLGLARTLGHRRIVAHHFLADPASGRMLRKVGFAPTGQILMRPSLGGGGGEEAAAVHAIELAHPGDCDDDAGAAMRAA